MTIGRGKVSDSEWRSCWDRSRISARDFKTSTVARRTVQTLIGSNVALRTRTRPPVGLADTSPRNFTEESGGGGRGGAEDLHPAHAATQRVERVGDVRVAGDAFEIGEEHVVAEAAYAPRTGLDLGQVDA